jgi:hypothetical protein
MHLSEVVQFLGVPYSSVSNVGFEGRLHNYFFPEEVAIVQRLPPHFCIEFSASVEVLSSMEDCRDVQSRVRSEI